MIDYMKQLNAFNERCQVTGLAPRARIVYYTLLDMNNRLFWVSSFRTTIRIIADRSGLNKNGVDFALRLLKNEGLIEYVPSTKKKSGSLIKICPLLGTETGTETGTKRLFNKGLSLIGDKNGDKTGDKTGDKNGDKNGDNNKTKTRQEKTKTEKEKEKAHSRIDVFAACDESENVKKALHDFAEMRLRMRSPMTDRAKELLLSKLNELSGGDDFMKIHLLEQSIERGWKTVYPLKAEVSTVRQSAPSGDPQSGIDRAIEFFRRQEEELYDQTRGDPQDD